MILVPLLNPKFANTLAARPCEFRVRGTSVITGLRPGRSDQLRRLLGGPAGEGIAALTKRPALFLEHFGAVAPALRHPLPSRPARGISGEFRHLLAIGGVTQEFLGRVHAASS